MTKNVPIGIQMLPNCHGMNRTLSYKFFIIIFTFLCYMSYHLSRKPISVVKSKLHENCTKESDNENHLNDSNWCDWSPFEKDNYSSLFGALDLAYLFAYAVGMFLSGHTAERMNLRYFLTLGMLSSGLSTAAFGFGYFFNIHSLVFYVVIQTAAGFVQSSGWPSVVTCMGNWYGKGKRGFIMGVWNSHTSVGNILGALIAGAFVDSAWGWSFVVPGIIIGSLGILVFLFLVPEPADVNCELPDHGHGPGNGQINSYANEEGYKDKEASDLLLQVEEIDMYMEYGSNISTSPSQASLVSSKKEKPISILGALKIPGVIEFSLCLFFSKLVNYTFLFWLPKYIAAKTSYSSQKAADISTFFDVGGIIGGVGTGLFSDYTGMSATACVIMLIISAPVLYIYNLFGSVSLAHSIGLSILCGAFVNGPYALITTAVSADLGTHKILQGNAKALSTVTAIIDGTGSIGAAVGPLLAGLIEPSGWNNVFYMLIGADIFAVFLLLRLMIKEIRSKKVGS